MRIRRRRPVVIEMTNPLGYPVVRIELVPGKEVRLTAHMVRNMCDRGLGSEDGKHRLVTRDIQMPFRIRLAEEPK